MKNLQDLMDFIGLRYLFSVENYPNISDIESKKIAFAINHSHLHMSKSLGRIATECEKYDHGLDPDYGIVKEATVKMFINTLKLAQELGMTAEQLSEAVPALMKSK